MGQIWWSAVRFALLIVIQSISSDLEGQIGELHFTIPVATKNFSDAASWCKNYYNSTLAVVNDSHSQTALTQVLNSIDRMSPWSTMYINIRLQKGQNSSWFLVNGSIYDGDIGNQDLPESMELNYLLYGHLNHDGNNFIVDASTPSSFRNYICDYKEESCSDESPNFIVNNGRCFVKYENETLTWFEARQRCIFNGGDLARFQSDPDDARFPPFNTSWFNKSLTYWVGIRWKHLSWKSPWSGQETIFTSWSNEEPNNYNNRCVCVDPNKSPVWSWIDCDCSIKRQFICVKRIVVQTQTPLTATPIAKTPIIAANTSPAVIKLATSFKIKPDTIAAVLTSRPKDPVTEFNLVIDNNPSTTEGKIDGRTIGLAVGIGGGGLILLIVSIVVLIVIIKRRKGRRNVSRGSGPGLESNGGDIGTTQNDVYAAVVANGKYQGTNPESSSEIIYTAPVFANGQTNSAPDKSIYEEANRVDSPDNIMVSTLRRQTQSMYPQ